MSKWLIILDFISGLFFAVDFLFPEKIGKRLGDWLVKQLPEKDEARNPVRWKTIRFNIAVTLFVFALIIVWDMAKNAGEYTALQAATEVGWFAIGSFIAVLLATLIAFAINKLGSYFQSESELIRFTWQFTFIISFVVSLAVLKNVLRLATGELTFLAAPILSFILTLPIFPVVMMYATWIRQFIDLTPGKKVYAFSRIGLIIFIASKIIEFTIN